MFQWIFILLDTLFFLFMAFSVGYLLVFALASLKKRKHSYPETIERQKIVIMFPAYKEDSVIMDAVKSVINQQYPQDLFDIVVISDRMKDETNDALAKLPIILLKINFENSSKAKALKFAIEQLRQQGKDYDTAVILDADNQVEPNFLLEINKTRIAGQKAIQAHRRAKNLNTSTAILDGVSEEINNSIFRSGHVRLNFSSALIGSGMAFDYEWFKANIVKVFTAGEDKELEALLLKQHIYVEYLEDVYVYDEKIQAEEAFKHQRRRWLAAQFQTLGAMSGGLANALREKNWDYCDKLVQMMMPPRVLCLAIILVCALITTFANFMFSIKWWVLLLLLFAALYIAIPTYMKNKELYKAFRKAPVLAFIMFWNLFHLKGASKKFIHTKHG